MKTLTIKIFYGILLLSLFVSCDEDNINTNEIRTQYDFENADFSGQATRIKMLEELTAYVKTAANGEQLQTQKLLDMFSNNNSPFSSDELNNTTKQLKNKTNLNPQINRLNFENYFNQLGSSSGINTTASNGVSGILISDDNRYFVSENGIEYAQFIDIGIMGATFYDQLVNNYLGDEKMNISLNVKEPDEDRTTLERYWDEAYGYFGASIDFPSANSQAKYLAKYCSITDAQRGTELKIMNAFIRGREAIKDENWELRDSSIFIIRTELEYMLAGTSIYYLNEALANFDNDAIRINSLSKSFALIHSLIFTNSATRKFESISIIDSFLEELNNNFYDIKITNINSIRNQLADIYEFDASQL